ncbi:MAG: uracil-DNA glycosylase [Bacteroidales bacterium]|nr:uracil-DNA glycosylase [Bacteroidales bacterium]
MKDIYIEEFNKLKTEVESCRKCALHESRNKIVFGNGSTDSKIFIIGEGPGYDEDKTGVAFVGKSGQLLEKIFQACGFERNKHIYIGNIVKCRPPQNRVPTIDEQRECLPYLEKQIELIDPKILVLLGSTALKAFFGLQSKITKERGQWKIYNNRYVMPTFHPSALLRNPSLKREAWEDFKMVIQKYREVVDAEHKCKYI